MANSASFSSFRHIKKPSWRDSARSVSVPVDGETNMPPQRHQEHPTSSRAAPVSSQTQPQVRAWLDFVLTGLNVALEFEKNSKW